MAGRPVVRGSRGILACVAALVLAVWIAPRSASAEPPRHVLPPSAMEFFRTLLPASELTRTLDVEIQHDHALLRFKRGAATVEIEAHEPSTCDKPAGPLCLGVVSQEGPGAGALAAAAIDALETAARKTSTTPGWVASWAAPLAGPQGHPEGAQEPLRLPWILAGRGPAWIVVGEAFIALVVAGAAVGALGAARRAGARTLGIACALFALALAIRFAAHPIPADIRSVVGELNGTRRAGWVCYLRLLFEVLPATHESVWNVNRVLGAVAAPTLFVLLRRRFSEVAAIAGAVTLAVLPFAARLSASDTPYIPLCAAFLGATVAFDRFVATRSRAACALGLGLLTCAMQLRPDGPWLVVPAALLVACNPIRLPALAAPARFAAPLLAFAACIAAINAKLSLWALTGHGSGGGPSSYLSHFIGAGELWGSPWIDLSISPWPLTVLAIAGLVVAARSGRVGILWAVATVVAMPFTESAIRQLSNARYHLPAVYLACGLVGLAVAVLVERAARLRAQALGLSPVATLAIAAGLPIVGALPRVDLLRRMWTPQIEFERFRSELKALGERCTVVSQMRAYDAGFAPFTDPGGADFLDFEEFVDAPRTAGCVLYYRAASCDSPDAIVPNGGPFHQEDGCRAFEQRVTLTPLSEWTVPALPYRGERYLRDPIPVGLYRIVGVRTPTTP